MTVVAVLGIGSKGRTPAEQKHVSGRISHTMQTLYNPVAKTRGVFYPVADLDRNWFLRELKEADSILILGGNDIEPSLYGGGNYPGEQTHSVEADLGQIAAVHYAVDSGKPLLGICRGHQIINVALGGNLIQDMNDHFSLDTLTTGKMLTHEVDVRVDSRLADILGKTQLDVESYHHQSVLNLGDGLRVSATHVDGTVEGIEHESLPIFGVQWHPEDLNANRQDFANLLKPLLEPTAIPVA